MARPEYHDRFWRFVEDLRVTSRRGAAQVTQMESAAPAPSLEADSALWHVSGASGDVTVSYRIHLPAPESPRASWRLFLAPTGGLVGGPQSFMYVVGREAAPARMTLDLPASWSVATGLQRTGDARVFTASDVEALVESPILAGRLRTWHFAVNGVPHTIAYWPLPNATPFDTTAFVSGIERLVRETMAVFGGAPYREFTFLFQDGAYGGLEHPTSVTSGAPSATLARSQVEMLQETAHEYFHTWNLVAIRPIERARVSFRMPTPESSLWFGEGFTLYYADLLLRRSGVQLPESTHEAHLGNLISRYLANPAYTHFSAEAISRADNSPPDALGDYSASTHLQGELIAAMLDFVVRDATQGRRSMDDVMRAMFRRSAGGRGITGADVERAVEDVCGCDVTPFFAAHVRGHEPIDFAQWLRLGGLSIEVASAPVRQRDGWPTPDLGIWGWMPPRDSLLKVIVGSPDNAWSRAGLHTGDLLLNWNGAPIRSWREMRSQVGRLHIGDTVTVEVKRPSGVFSTTVAVTGYDRPTVVISPLLPGTEALFAKYFTRGIFPAAEWQTNRTRGSVAATGPDIPLWGLVSSSSFRFSCSCGWGVSRTDVCTPNRC